MFVNMIARDVSKHRLVILLNHDYATKGTLCLIDNGRKLFGYVTVCDPVGTGFVCRPKATANNDRTYKRFCY
ncbi:hypothetical protein TUM4433_28450 [Shewanella schlegeliana]|nr:hypothetical protein TUM4433_28450 [Shewanella schlegeliana]